MWRDRFHMGYILELVGYMIFLRTQKLIVISIFEGETMNIFEGETMKKKVLLLRSNLESCESYQSIALIESI